jgi:hypothetical protein
MRTINRIWFINRLKNGELLYRCDGKYTDDYAYDAAYNFFKTETFEPAPPDLLSEFVLSRAKIWGDKNGEIHFCFASCQYYTFKLK